MPPKKRYKGIFNALDAACTVAMETARMAFAPSLIINQYKDLSVEELEKKYEELKKNYCFETKEEQIKYIVDNLLDASHSVNTNSTKVGIEELLKEKTGKEYKIEPKTFEINL